MTKFNSYNSHGRFFLDDIVHIMNTRSQFGSTEKKMNHPISHPNRNDHENRMQTVHKLCLWWEKIWDD